MDPSALDASTFEPWSLDLIEALHGLSVCPRPCIQTLQSVFDTRLRNTSDWNIAPWPWSWSGQASRSLWEQVAYEYVSMASNLGLLSMLSLARARSLSQMRAFESFCGKVFIRWQL